MKTPSLLAVLAALVLALSAPVGATDPPPADPIGPEIVGGVAVGEGELPFMAVLTSNRYFRCGGTVIDDEWVLTAAHCTDGLSLGSLEVLVGRTTLSAGGGQWIGVAEVYEHPRWTPATYQNDIALLHLAAPATAAEPVYWATEALSDWFAPETTATVAGWGHTENVPVGTGTGVQDTMRKVDVPIRYPRECADSVPGGEFFNSQMICAGLPTGGKDACQGDSGGPIFVEEGDRYRQVGIVSWGYGCADPGEYGFYTRLATYDSWIVDTTGLTTCEGAPATVVGTARADTLRGTRRHDVIVAGAGSDTVRAGGGDDIVCGGDDNDLVYAGAGRDLVFGGEGRDRLYGAGGGDALLGGGGDDAIRGGEGDDRALGGDGDDVIWAGTGRDLVEAGEGADVVYAGRGDDRVFGGDGDDALYPGRDDDEAYGGHGDDRLYGATGDDLLYGQSGDDEVRGQGGDDEVRGGGDDDLLYGGAGIDRLVGGFGTDLCKAGEVGFFGCETIE